MKVCELIDEFREQADDEAVPHLWKEQKLIRWINQAQEEAARRSRILIDASTAEVVRYVVPSKKVLIKLHRAVIKVTHAQFEIPSLDPDCPPRIIPLTIEKKGDLDRCRPCWREECGDPRSVVTDFESGCLRFDRIPECAGVLRIECARMPLIKIENKDSQLEIPDRYQLDLVYWVLFRAYSKQDSDTYDKKKSSDALAMFTAIYGEPSTPQTEVLTGYTPNTRRSVTRFY